MKALMLSLAMTAFALPAFAQSSDTQAQSGTDQTSPANAQKLKDDLSKAGFKQVEILDATYLVRAETEQGNRVLMLIDPPADMGQTTGSTPDKTQQQ
ncbi:hypothetical protein CN934_28135 [Ensifer sp. MMN_5]|uniref:hypothetical protein n=1 Tax=Rhizobium meliloti TaxID=382 RepID=UPI000C9CBF2A|nr:hypothetical protein CN934_28135 [Ensifer sp. MMN_5]